MSARRRAKPFTPGKEAATTLDARTVGRDDVLRVIAGKLANVATSRNRPHTLLVGPRGAGKTHLLEVALHRARRDVPAFDRHVVVVRLDEDLVGVPRLVDLQREILRHLGAARPDPGVYLPDVIAAALGDRVLLLVVENLDRLFATLRVAGQQDFRGWVETSRQIMLLGSAPLLFPGISDRSLPWWGSFTVVHLDELTLDEGRALLVHRAEEDGDDELVTFLRSDRGLARLRAVDALTGGSPRIWMILSDVITVELLDDLTPAVEALLEGLVPYYQQLLWDLSPVEQLAVRALAEGSRQAMSVGELAAATDTDQRSLSTTLGRLVESKWLRAEKHEGADRRLTFYRLREPMLRHHLHYRSLTDQPLPLIVDILRAWFDLGTIRTHLDRVPIGSERERALSASLASDPMRFDQLATDPDLDDLLAGARTWIATERDTDQYEAGVLVEQCVLLARDGKDAADAARAVRSSRSADTFARLDDTDVPPGSDHVDAVGVLLDVAARTATHGRHQVELLAICWNAQRRGWSTTEQRLLSLLERVPSHDRVHVVVAAELVAVTWRVRGFDSARALLDRVQPTDAGSRLDVDNARAWLVANGSDHEAGVALYHDLLRAQEQQGSAPAAILNTRYNLAVLASRSGDSASAHDQAERLVADCVLTFGHDDLRTLRARRVHAEALGERGDVDGACDLLVDLLVDRIRIFGSDDARSYAALPALGSWMWELDDARITELMLRAADKLPDSTPATTLDLLEIETAHWRSDARAGGRAVLRLFALKQQAEAAGERERIPALSGGIRDVLRTFLLDLRGHRYPLLAPPDTAEGETVNALIAAIDGDLGARATIPSELLAVVDGVSADLAASPR